MHYLLNGEPHTDVKSNRSMSRMKGICSERDSKPKQQARPQTTKSGGANPEKHCSTPMGKAINSKQHRADRYIYKETKRIHGEA